MNISQNKRKSFTTKNERLGAGGIEPNELKIFNFEGNQIRVQFVDGEPVFIAKDVASALGYKYSADAIGRHVHEEDKSFAPIQTNGGKQVLTIINESGLYALVLGSKLDSATNFKRWVTKEVLPSIRKNEYKNKNTNPVDGLRSMLSVTKHTKAGGDKFERQTITVDRNLKLSPNEYAYIGKLISQKVYQIGKEELFSMTRKQTRILFNAINGEINNMTGALNRSSLLKKDYESVIVFVNGWQPSESILRLMGSCEHSGNNFREPAITEIEDAIYDELFEIRDFKKFFIAVGALKGALKNDELKDLIRVVASNTFMHRFGEKAISIMVVDIEMEMVLSSIKAQSPEKRVRTILSEYEKAEE